MQYLDRIRKEARVIVVGSPTGGMANQDTASVRRRTCDMIPLIRLPALSGKALLQGAAIL